MKAADLMRAMESRPDALEAAAPSLHGSDRKPDISDVLGRIRGGQTQPDFQAPAPKIVQTKHSRLVPAMLTACSIAACAAVVTGLAFLIRDSHEAVESSDAAMLIPAGTEEADADIAAEPVTEQSAEAAESEAEDAPQTEPADGAEAQSNIIVTDKTEPVSGTVKSEAQPAPNTEPADAEAPLVTAKTVPTTAVRQQNDETIVRTDFGDKFLAVHFGHPDIGQDDVERLFRRLNFFPCISAIGSLHDIADSELGEKRVQNGEVQCDIIRDQDLEVFLDF